MSEYFSRLIDLLKIERDEDLRSYRALTESSSVAERRASGLSWYPIAIKGSEISHGDYLTVEIERTTHQELIHQFRFGGSVALFSNHDPKDRIEGTIAYQSGSRMKITLKTDELPDWVRQGKLGVDALFDNNSYREMQGALKRASIILGADDRKVASKLLKILTGQLKPSFLDQVVQQIIPQLNTTQQLAVDKILSAQELAIVHGPPGTGKTTTLVQAIKALIKQDHHQILMVAPSNTAVDLLTEKLDEEGLNVLRIGNPVRVSEKLLSLTLDGKMEGHPAMKQMKAFKKQANEFKNMAHKYKRNFGRSEKEQRKALFDEAHKIMKEVENTEQYIIDDLISKAQVVTATLIGANHYTIRNLNFHTLVIDEAGQALEPACWIPILKADKVVFAGDHCQLSPTIKSNEAARLGLNRTLLEKAIVMHPESVVLLEEQYRMNEAIMGYPSKVFYGSKLKAHSTVVSHRLFSGDIPLAYVDTAGCGFDEMQESTSVTNPEEAVFLFKHLSQLVSELVKHYTLDDFPTVGVISPYKQQVILMRELLNNHPGLQEFAHKIAVNTIDSFQGQERDVIYISMTRSNAEGSIGFLSDIRRMNVAMTRARKKLVIIGDSATLSRMPFYSDFIAYAEEQNAYQSAWEFVEMQ